MSSWAPSLLLQYRPHTLDKFVLHKDIAGNLQKLVRLETTVAAGRSTVHAQRRIPGRRAGGERRLSTHTVLWAFRSREENPDPGPLAGDLWRWRREGEAPPECYIFLSGSFGQAVNSPAPPTGIHKAWLALCHSHFVCLKNSTK